jgi:hypothetical protein
MSKSTQNICIEPRAKLQNWTLLVSWTFKRHIFWHDHSVESSRAHPFEKLYAYSWPGLGGSKLCDIYNFASCCLWVISFINSDPFPNFQRLRDQWRLLVQSDVSVFVCLFSTEIWEWIALSFNTKKVNAVMNRSPGVFPLTSRRPALN